MKFLTIAIFIFMIHVSAAAINGLGLDFSESYSFTPDKTYIGEANETVSTQSYFQADKLGEPSIRESISDTIGSFFQFVKIFAKSIIALPYTLRQFGMDATMANIISGPIYLIYMLGIMNWIGNKQTKGMD